MYDYQAIAALAAVVHTGSFDKAAQQLGVTASAISQRIKLLEERMGSVLVVRAQPLRCCPTSTFSTWSRELADMAQTRPGEASG